MRFIFYFNLKHYIKNKDEVFYLSFFFAIINVIGYFNIEKYNIDNHIFFLSSLLVALFIICIQSSLFNYQRNTEAGIADIYRQLNISMYLIAIVNLMANFVAILVVILLALPWLYLMGDQPAATFFHTYVGLGVGSLALLIVGHLISSLAVTIARGRAIIMLLAFPFLIPVLVFTNAYLQHPEILIQPALLFVLGYSLLLLPLLCLTAASVVAE